MSRGHSERRQAREEKLKLRRRRKLREAPPEPMPVTNDLWEALVERYRREGR